MKNGDGVKDDRDAIYLWKSDVAKMLNCSTRTVDRWIAIHFFPESDFMIGKRRAWKNETVEKWLLNQTTN